MRIPRRGVDKTICACDCVCATQPSLLVKQSASVLTAMSHSAPSVLGGPSGENSRLTPARARAASRRSPTAAETRSDRFSGESRSEKVSEGDTERAGAAATNSFAICVSLAGSCLENGSALAHKGEGVKQKVVKQKGADGKTVSQHLKGFFVFSLARQLAY